MSDFHPIRELQVFRHLSNARKVKVGILAQNKQTVFFQYDADYLKHFPSLSPFKLPFDGALHSAPPTPHYGLFGVFADSLPDGWGLFLMDRVFRQQGILPQQITAMDRLAYIGLGMGALEYLPISDYRTKAEDDRIDLTTLGEQARALFEGQTETVLTQLANAGGSGGARPKAQIYIDPQHTEYISTHPHKGLEPWLIKFTSSSLPLGHEEGLCEAAYLTLAAHAGIDVPQWQLISSKDKHWLAMHRFDCSPKGGRYHLHSLCGLLDADFRMPSIDYEDLIKASQILCQSPAVGQTQFSRAIFNLFALNQDDHSKNWAFLQQDNGQWQPAPFYDVTFSPNTNGEHTTAFLGYGKQPPLKAIQKLSEQANFANWKQAQMAIEKVVDTIQGWDSVAKELGISVSTRKLIQKQLDAVRKENQGLLGYRVIQKTILTND